MVHFSAVAFFLFMALAVSSQIKRRGSLDDDSRESHTWPLRGLHAILPAYVRKHPLARIWNIRLSFFSTCKAPATRWKPVCRRLASMSCTRQPWCIYKSPPSKISRSFGKTISVRALQDWRLQSRWAGGLFLHKAQTPFVDKLASQKNRGARYLWD